MPGPGGPGPAAQRALAQRLNPLLEKQVLIVQFPGTSPEVFIACADPVGCTLQFCEASVSAGNDVDVGTLRSIAWADIGAVRTTDNILHVLGLERQVLANIHFEEAEAHRTWTEGIRAVISDASAAGGAENDGGDGDSELVMLQARSRQLQSKISGLEAVNERRDKQLNKMVRRLDGAMQMLSAVQDMCKQQGNVIRAQKVSIVSLQRDLGFDMEAENGDAGARHASPKASGGGGSMDSEDSPENDHQDPEDDSVEADEAKLMALLAQADQMQKMLQALEGQAKGAELGSESSGSPMDEAARQVSQLGNVPASPARNAGSPSAPAGGPEAMGDLMAMLGGAGGGQGEAGDLMGMLSALMGGAGGLGNDPSALAALLGGLEGLDGGALGEENEEEEDEAEEQDLIQLQPPNAEDSEEAALERLEGLEAQKKHFEDLLQGSQQEHKDLLEKLAGMRSLMASLGLQEDGGDDEGSDGVEN